MKAMETELDEAKEANCGRLGRTTGNRVNNKRPRAMVEFRRQSYEPSHLEALLSETGTYQFA
jgi:hypothetical protein